MTDEQVIAVGDPLSTFLDREGVRTLRRKLKELTEAPPDDPQEIAKRKEHARAVQKAWLRGHTPARR